MSGRYQYFLKRKKLYLCIKHNLMRNLIKLLLTHIEKKIIVLKSTRLLYCFLVVKYNQGNSHVKTFLFSSLC